MWQRHRLAVKSITSSLFDFTTNTQCMRVPYWIVNIHFSLFMESIIWYCSSIYLIKRTRLPNVCIGKSCTFYKIFQFRCVFFGRCFFVFSSGSQSTCVANWRNRFRRSFFKLHFNISHHHMNCYFVDIFISIKCITIGLYLNYTRRACPSSSARYYLLFAIGL